MAAGLLPFSPATSVDPGEGVGRCQLEFGLESADRGLDVGVESGGAGGGAPGLWPPDPNQWRLLSGDSSPLSFPSAPGFLLPSPGASVTSSRSPSRPVGFLQSTL